MDLQLSFLKHSNPAPKTTFTSSPEWYNNGMEIAVFGGGCFWCTEAVFAMLKGVRSAVPGYVKGIEVVRMEFDPQQISYRDLLTVFFATHDPTSIDRQGADIGPQYLLLDDQCSSGRALR